MFLFIRFATSKRMGCDGDVLIFEIFFFILVWKKSSLWEEKLIRRGDWMLSSSQIGIRQTSQV